jgi:hypothetical protein
MKMGLTWFASVHPTRDSEATETNDLKKIELLNATRCGRSGAIQERQEQLETAKRGFDGAIVPLCNAATESPVDSEALSLVGMLRAIDAMIGGAADPARPAF